MTRKTFSLLSCVIFSFLLAACAETVPKPPDATKSTPGETPAALSETAAAAPPAEIVQASAPPVELKAGGTAEATVRVSLADGYHINGNPASKFQIATTLDVQAGEGITAGKVLYPPSITKTFEFSKEPILVYEKEAIIKQTLRAEAGAAKGSRTLSGKLKVQPCDNKVCYPPRTLDISLPVNVK